MTITVDLFGEADCNDGEGHMWSADVAKFTEVPEVPRVFADSQHYITYTTKKGNSLRVVKRLNLARGTVRGHTTPIHSVRFVNYRSNVAASASKGEFFVWVVTDSGEGGAGRPSADAELTINMYFRLSDPVTISCFSFFINAENKRPDVLVLHDQQASILDSSALIALYRDTPLTATLKQNSTALRKLASNVTANTLCSVGSGGWFAFTTDSNMVAACTLQNRNTPPWSCCEGAPVHSLHLLDTPHAEKTTLVASCSRVVYQWSLSGASEPTLLRKFAVDGTIVSLEGSRDSFAVFNDKRKLAVVRIQSPKEFTCTRYTLPWQVRRRGTCFNCVGGESYIMADNDDRLTVMQLKANASSGAGKRESPLNTRRSPAGAAKPASNVLAPTTGTKIKSNSSTQPTGSIIANLVNRLGICSVGMAPPASSNTSSPATATATGSAPDVTSASANATQRGALHGYSNQPVTAGLGSGGGAGASKVFTPALSKSLAASAGRGHGSSSISPASAQLSAAVNANNLTHSSRPALHNASLPQAPTDGVLATVLQQTEDEVHQELERLDSVMKNTLQVLQLTPDTIHRAHEQLLSLSLEAQMTELQQQQERQKNASLSNSAGFTPFETCVLLSILDPLSQSIANGLTRGVEDAMMANLEHGVRHALVNRARTTQKSAMKARLDEVLKESSSQFLAQVEQTVRNVVENELAEVFGDINGLLTALENDNVRLQRELEAIMASDVITEMKKTREELESLREAVANQQLAIGTGSELVSRPSPETVLSTTTELIQQQQYRQGLEYIIMAEQPQLVLQLFIALKKKTENVYSALIEDPATPNDVWLRVIVQITGAATSEEDIDAVVGVLIDILSEREQLLQKTGPTAKLTESLHSFVTVGKSGRKCSAGLRNFKNLEKLLP